MSFRDTLSAGAGPLRHLTCWRPARRHRASSHDPSGGNSDRVPLLPGETHALLDVDDTAGCLTHLWITMNGPPTMFRDCVLRAWWDGEATPSVEVPVGDFFGIGHCIVRNWWSLPLSMSPQDGRGFNCWFPMPFETAARVELANEGTKKAETVRSLYYYVDYETYARAPETPPLHFHAQWRRANPCPGKVPSHHAMMEHGLLKNPDGADNYVFVDARVEDPGPTRGGHVVGVILNVHNLRPHMEGNWWGEGDDMWWIDADFEHAHPTTGHPVPSLLGTGTEDFFNTAWCPTQEFCTPYHGISLYGASGMGSEVHDVTGPGHFGKHTYYRFFLADPVYFTRRVRGSLEHGHGNGRSDDFASVAYWYQSEPHAPFPPLPPAPRRRPNPDVLPPLDLPGMEDEHYLWDDPP